MDWQIGNGLAMDWRWIGDGLAMDSQMVFGWQIRIGIGLADRLWSDRYVHDLHWFGTLVKDWS